MSIGGGGYDGTRYGRFLVLNSPTESATALTLIASWDAAWRK